MKKLGLDKPSEFSSGRQGRSMSTTMNTQSTNDENKNTANNPETRMEVHYIYSSTLASDPGEPKTYTAALNGDDKKNGYQRSRVKLII